MAYSIPLEHGIATPIFEIWLDDREISAEYYKMVEEVNFESHVSGSDIATIFMHDPYLVVVDDIRLFKGKKVKLFGGWRGDIVEWLEGYVAMIDIVFPETADPSITLHCMDQSYLLDRLEVHYSYHDVTFSQIAAEIAKRHGLGTNGKATSHVHENVTQSGETDITLLTRLADDVDNDLVIKVKNNEITWRPKTKTYEVQERLTWKNTPFNLRSFRPRIVTADKREGIARSDVHDGTKTVDEGVATPDIIDRMDDGSAGTGLGEESVSSPTFEYNPRTGLWHTRKKEAMEE